MSLHDQGGSAVELAAEVAVIDTVALTVEDDPRVLRETIRGVEAIDHALGEPAVVGHVRVVHAELDHRARGGAAMTEDNTLHHEMIAAQPQQRPAFDEHVSGIFSTQRDRRGCGPASGPSEDEVVPDAIDHHDHVAGSRIPERDGQLVHVARQRRCGRTVRDNDKREESCEGPAGDFRRGHGGREWARREGQR